MRLSMKNIILSLLLSICAFNMVAVNGVIDEKVLSAGSKLGLGCIVSGLGLKYHANKLKFNSDMTGKKLSKPSQRFIGNMRRGGRVCMGLGTAAIALSGAHEAIFAIVNFCNRK